MKYQEVQEIHGNTTEYLEIPFNTMKYEKVQWNPEKYHEMISPLRSCSHMMKAKNWGFQTPPHPCQPKLEICQPPPTPFVRKNQKIANPLLLPRKRYYLVALQFKKQSLPFRKKLFIWLYFQFL